MAQQLPGTTSETIKIVPSIPVASYLPRIYGLLNLLTGKPGQPGLFYILPNNRVLLVNTRFVPGQPAFVAPLAPVPKATAPSYPGQFGSAPLPVTTPPMAFPQVQYNAASKFGNKQTTVILFPNVLALNNSAI